MNTQPFFPAPCYLNLNRGFYAGVADITSAELEAAVGEGSTQQLFTANIRRATAFSRFAEAEAMFKKLLAADLISHYFAVVAGMQAPIDPYGYMTASELAASPKEVHPANCICPLCLSY